MLESAPFKLAIAQMLVVDGDLLRNLGRAQRLVGEAAAARAKVVVLPECMDLGWMSEKAASLAQTIPGVTSQRLCELARRHRLYIATGITERAGDRVYNAALLIGPNGEILLKHRKLNELTIGQSIYSPGESLGVARTAVGSLGLCICADLSPGAIAIGHALAHMRAQVILAPAVWAVPPDHDQSKTPYGAMWKQSYMALAKAHRLTVIGVSSVGTIASGPWASWPVIGCSLAVGPDGNVLVEGPYGASAEALMYVDVHPQPRELMNW